MQSRSALKLPDFTLLLAFVALVSACATIQSKGVDFDPSGRGELTDEFRNGSARLECDLRCVAVYGANRRELKALHDAGLWSDLAINVLRIGFSIDQAYYYLGKAAEGLGYHPGAEHYYRRSIALAHSGPACGTFVNVCDGFDFPRDAEFQLAEVLKRKASSIVQRKDTSSAAVPVKTEGGQPRDCKRAYGEYFEKAQATSASEKAIALYRAGLALCPDDDIAHYELGKVLAARGRYAEAAKELETALTINPDFIDARKQLDAVRKKR